MMPSSNQIAMGTSKILQGLHCFSVARWFSEGRLRKLDLPDQQPTWTSIHPAMTPPLVRSKGRRKPSFGRTQDMHGKSTASLSLDRYQSPVESGIRDNESICLEVMASGNKMVDLLLSRSGLCSTFPHFNEDTYIEAEEETIFEGIRDQFYCGTDTHMSSVCVKMSCDFLEIQDSGRSP